MLKNVFFIFFVLMFSSFCLQAEVVNVAVASNFTPALKQLATDFENKTGHHLRISSGSSGKLFAQITHGAPFDIFLSADEERPDLLVKATRAKAENTYIYALGRLLLLSNIQAENCQNILHSKQLMRLAIANPATAPYGSASREVLVHLGVWQGLQPKLATGENIMQAMQYVVTRNAQAGFVAKSLLHMGKAIDNSCIWEVPAELHPPIRQKMLLLNKAGNKAAALSFMQYMRSPAARKIIQSAGYDVPPVR